MQDLCLTRHVVATSGANPLRQRQPIDAHNYAPASVPRVQCAQMKRVCSSCKSLRNLFLTRDVVTEVVNPEEVVPNKVTTNPSCFSADARRLHSAMWPS